VSTRTIPPVTNRNRRVSTGNIPPEPRLPHMSGLFGRKVAAPSILSGHRDVERRTRLAIDRSLLRTGRGARRNARRTTLAATTPDADVAVVARVGCAVGSAG